MCFLEVTCVCFYGVVNTCVPGDTLKAVLRGGVESLMLSVLSSKCVINQYNTVFSDDTACVVIK